MGTDKHGAVGDLGESGGDVSKGLSVLAIGPYAPIRIPSTAPPSQFGTGFTVNSPVIIGREVPRASIRRNEDVSPGKTVWANVENTNALRPNPDITREVAEAR